MMSVFDSHSSRSAPPVRVKMAVTRLDGAVEWRRFSSDKIYRHTSFISTLEFMFPCLQGKKGPIYYVDSEGDLVTITVSEEWAEAVRQYNLLKMELLRLRVREAEWKAPATTIYPSEDVDIPVLEGASVESSSSSAGRSPVLAFNQVLQRTIGFFNNFLQLPELPMEKGQNEHNEPPAVPQEAAPAQDAQDTPPVPHSPAAGTEDSVLSIAADSDGYQREELAEENPQDSPRADDVSALYAMGFDTERVSAALAECRNNCLQALDLLLATEFQRHD